MLLIWILLNTVVLFAFGLFLWLEIEYQQYEIEALELESRSLRSIIKTKEGRADRAIETIKKLQKILDNTALGLGISWRHEITTNNDFLLSDFYPLEILEYNLYSFLEQIVKKDLEDKQ
jgi:hypothetical protein